MRRPKEHFTEAQMPRDLAARVMQLWGDGLGGAVCLSRRNDLDERMFLEAGKKKIEDWIAKHADGLLARSGVRPELRTCPCNPDRLCLHIPARKALPGERLLPYQLMVLERVEREGAGACPQMSAAECVKARLRRLQEIADTLTKSPEERIRTAEARSKAEYEAKLARLSRPTSPPEDER